MANNLRKNITTLLKIFSLIYVFFTPATSYSDECANDVHNCTPIELCEVATGILGDTREWKKDEAFVRHVKLAEKMGLNCNRILPLSECEKNPKKCSLGELCSAAVTVETPISWRKNNPHAELAQKYELTCGIGKAKDSEPQAKPDLPHEPTPLSQASEKKELKVTQQSNDVVDQCISEDVSDWDNCIGTFKFSNGFIYEGTFSKGNVHGEGRITTPKGEIFQGTFVDNRLTGQGKYENPDGQIYEGSFKNDLPHGFGVLTQSTGEVYEGEFAYGKFEGIGRYRYSDGREIEAVFENNKIKSILNDKNIFQSMSLLKRQKTQFALKQLGFYSKSIDGIWGAGTERALQQYRKSMNSEARANELISDLLSKVKTPNYFAPPKKKKAKPPAAAAKPSVNMANLNSDQKACLRSGFTFGTEAFLNCTLIERQNRLREADRWMNLSQQLLAPPPRRNTTTCTRLGSNMINCW